MNQPAEPVYTDRQFLITHLWPTIVMLSLALVAIPIAGKGFLKPADVSADDWLMRGGAVITIFALIADTLLNRTFEFLHPRGMGCRRTSELRKKYRPLLAYISGAALGTSIIGAFIWGYGDLIYRAMD